ncbi:CGNR zinc finger domain-containing protein [Nocardia uniformis]|uniref:CGNR zinc finger domain-containing protein n=1 Tax=Nocardia uniformis TaxID=53432 RepID=A0A849BX63_9NOCA|nr:CGNR zinc finger domain-containing protein [Nocardia uniformis]NNH69768.1 CGNR zinc finger domain-containing protein [Nocardia uniformis]
MSELEPLIGEPLALDLVNTRPVDADLLATPEQLAHWLGLQAERLTEPLGQPARADLAAVREVRDHTAAVLDALLHDRRPPAAALRGLADAQSAAPAIRRLRWDGTALAATPQRSGTPGARLAATLADAAVDLLTDPAIARLKRCAADDCVMLFLPAHPRRQWCSPERCGNRARVARYYQRHKATTN